MNSQVQIDDRARRARLALRHRLAPFARTDDPNEIARSVVALHSSDPASVYLSVAARQSTPRFEPLEAALYEDRTLVRHHAMRRTIWVMPVDTAADAHAACTQQIAGAERRRTMNATGWTEEFMDESIETLVKLVAEAGPITTREIGRLRPDLTDRVVLGVGTRNPATIASHTRLLLHAGFEALIVRGRPSGSWISSEYAWSETMSWVGRPIAGGQPGPAAARILERWLESFGPGTETDVRWWTGWTLGKTRKALADVGAEPVTLENGSTGYTLDRNEVEDPGPWVALLPGLDPTAMGWKERTWYLDATTSAKVMDPNGNIGPTIWADGTIVGGWAQRADGTIAIDLNRPLDDAHRDLLDEEIERLVDVVGPTRFRTRFPSPNQSDLLA